MNSEDIKILDELFTAKIGIIAEKVNTTNERLEGLKSKMDAEFINVHDRLDSVDNELKDIKIQTTKTNGRVTELEKIDGKHFIDCPNVEIIANNKEEIDKKLKELDVDLREYRFFKKYPKIAIGIVVISCIALFIGGYIAWNKFSIQITEQISNEIQKDTNINNNN